MKPEDIFLKNKRWIWKNPDTGKVKDVTDYPFWWICKNGHEFQSTIGSRIKNKECPFCKIEKN